MHAFGCEIRKSESFGGKVTCDSERADELVADALAESAVVYARVAAKAALRARLEIGLGVSRRGERGCIVFVRRLCTAFFVRAAVTQALVQSVDVFAVRFRNVGQRERGGLARFRLRGGTALCGALFVEYAAYNFVRHRSSSSSSSMFTITDLICSSV